MEEMLGRLLKQPLDKERHWRSPLSSLLVRVLFIARSGEWIKYLTEALWRTISEQLLCILRYGKPA